MGKKLLVLAMVLIVSLALSARPARAQLYQINSTSIEFDHYANFTNTDAGFVPTASTVLYSHLAALPPVDVTVPFTSTASNPTGSLDGGMSRSSASSSVRILGLDQSFSIAPGFTSLSDKGALTTLPNPRAGLSIIVNSSITFYADSGPSTMTFTVPSIQGNVGPDVGDSDSLNATLTLTDTANVLGFNGVSLPLGPFNDTTPGDLFNPQDLFTSTDLPSFPKLDTLYFQLRYNLFVRDAADDAEISLNGGGIVQSFSAPEPVTVPIMLAGLMGLLSRRRVGGRDRH
jgi:hypothetical protein